MLGVSGRNRELIIAETLKRSAPRRIRLASSPVDMDVRFQADQQRTYAAFSGGASGIGAACAKRLAAEGAQVVVGDVATDGAQHTAQAIVAEGGTASATVGKVVTAAASAAARAGWSPS